MRTRTVCCARTPNLEIAFFSGDFLPAGGAFPWRRQDGVPKGRKGLASPPGEAPPQAVMRGITITDTRRGLGDARKTSPAVTVFDGYVKNRSSRRAHAIPWRCAYRAVHPSAVCPYLLL